MKSEEHKAIVQALSTRLTAVKLKEFIPHQLHIKLPRIQQKDGLLAAPLRSAAELAGVLVDLSGAEILRDRNIRLALLESTSDEQLAELMEAVRITGRGRKKIVDSLGTRKWTPGKYWARTFVRVLNLPPSLAGMPDDGSRDAIEVVEAYVPLPKLHDFQSELCCKILKMLGAPSGQNRAILSMPTGAGKTRTAVEALIQHLRQNEDCGAILWIAQNDELCEQAIISFREVWTERLIHEARTRYVSPPRPLHLYRFWGGHSCTDPVSGSVVVSSIQKIGKLTDVSFREFLSEVDVIVIDEAHHAIAPSYSPFFDRQAAVSSLPILGLTATPFRGNDEECRRLINRFRGNLLTPDFSDPIHRLRELGILSLVRSECARTQTSFTLTASELDKLSRFHDLSPETLEKIGNDTGRNRTILLRLLQITSGTPVLFFCCSVAHAHTMALLLRREGRTAAAITHQTPLALRRQWIQDFKGGEIDYLCNVGVLTTGFDAPKVEVIAIARPTGSVLLYEQMVGRGLRGPGNGGTPECLIIDFVDNIAAFDEPMSYTRISALWEQSSRFLKKVA